MTQNRNAPAGNRDESQDQRATRSTSILPSGRRYPRKIRLSDIADAIGQANADVDRYYAEMCRRPAKPFTDPNSPTYAELERRRGNHERADQIAAANARRFAEVR